MSSNVKAHVVNKHDIEANWNKAVNFIPKAGEIIVYEVDDNHDGPRFKVGNGKDTITNLPFSASKYKYITEDVENDTVTIAAKTQITGENAYIKIVLYCFI